MAYHDERFLKNIEMPIKTIFEIGSRDILDAVRLVQRFGADIYSFECNPDCLEICYKNYKELDPKISRFITIIPFAVASKNSELTFYPFDKTKYDNIGSSSMYKIDFSRRNKNDPDYNRPNPQKEIKVQGIRIDTFCKDNAIDKIDLVCMDLQGFELEALKGFGDKLKDVHYLITESAINSTYIGGTKFTELKNYLKSYEFELGAHNIDGITEIPETATGFSEFDCLFINKAFKST